MKKIKYETPNLRIKGFNLEPPKGKELEYLALMFDIKRKWWGLETDSHLFERVCAARVEMMRKKS